MNVTKNRGVTVMDYYFGVGTSLGNSNNVPCYQRCHVSDGQYEKLFNALFQIYVLKIKKKFLVNFKKIIQETKQRMSFT
jgi:hypothetical protein